MAFQLISYPGPGELARAVAGRWLDVVRARGTGKFTVALSGGRIAKDMFREMARQSLERGATMEGVNFFWADERCVPPSDPESNYGIARGLLFDPLRVPAAQIHRLQGEKDAAAAAREAAAEMASVTAPNGAGLPVLDLVFLGMGEDGHVASLFPGESPEVTARAEVYRAVTAVKPPPRRITLGYGVITAAKQAWVVVSGAGKEQALRESLSPQGKTPLSRVLRSRAETLIFSDLGPPQG